MKPYLVLLSALWLTPSGWGATPMARGVKWAATGRVTQKVPPDFPTAERVSTR